MRGGPRGPAPAASRSTCATRTAGCGTAAAIAEATDLLERSLRLREPGPYALQAGIALCHDRARSFAATDWGWIASLYAELQRIQPTPVVALNRAVAVSFAQGPRAGLALLDELDGERALRDYVPLLAARADLLRRAGDLEAADAAYAQAIERTANAAQRADLVARRARAAGALRELRAARPRSTFAPAYMDNVDRVRRRRLSPRLPPRCPA